MPRLLLLAAAFATLAGCIQTERAEPTPAEDRLLAYLARDPYVTIEMLERDADGHLLVTTLQGGRSVRYLIAPDDPARPELRLRPMADASTLDATTGGGAGGAIAR